jgi:FtsZ-binding cell division protein ZapB
MIMTDNDIIKALEFCADSRDTDKHCLKCPYCNESYCLDKMMADALDLINRQKAEIERLKEKHKLAVEEREANVKGFTESLKTVKAEAIKEFAERLKEKGMPVTGGRGFEGVYVMCSNIVIDNLVKEMVGDA